MQPRITNATSHPLCDYALLLCTQQLPATMRTAPCILALHHAATGADDSLDGKTYIIGIHKDAMHAGIIHEPGVAFRACLPA